MKLIKQEKISLKNHSEFNEKWVQQVIADDPTVLGLGDLILKDIERRQPHAGRLDLLLYDSETNQRYEVEIQLGSTDGSHIIRTIEYWDIERKRYPQYEHIAVIIAEDITARFLNVISLFNGFIPLIALQMNAYVYEDNISLLFTKVLDQVYLGTEEEEDDDKQVADRSLWERKASPEMLKIADDIMNTLKNIDKKIEPKYNKYYIGISQNGITNNFLTLHPKRQRINIKLYINKSEEIEKLFDEENIEYQQNLRCYRLNITAIEYESYKNTFKDILKRVYDENQ